jgi:hypothetical protein
MAESTGPASGVCVGGGGEGGREGGREGRAQLAAGGPTHHKKEGARATPSTHCLRARCLCALLCSQQHCSSTTRRPENHAGTGAPWRGIGQGSLLGGTPPGSAQSRRLHRRRCLWAQSPCSACRACVSGEMDSVRAWEGVKVREEESQRVAKKKGGHAVSAAPWARTQSTGRACTACQLPGQHP